MAKVVFLVCPDVPCRHNYAKVNFPNFIHIDPHHFEDYVEENEALLRARAANENVLINWDNATKTDRRCYIDIFKRDPKYGNIECHIFDVALGDSEVVKKFLQKLDEPRFAEGFNFIKTILPDEYEQYSEEVYREKALIFDLHSVIGNKSKSKSIHPSNLYVPEEVNRILSKYYDLGFLLISITNMVNVSLGSMTEEKGQLCIASSITKIDPPLTDIFYCSHAVQEKCKCKKPYPLMGFEALTQYYLDLNKSILVGHIEGIDKPFGRNVGIRNFIPAQTFFKKDLHND